jgi:hypothetical protein
MKVELLRLDSANKPSPIPEGVVEIQINSQPCKGINLTTRHTQAQRAPRVATVHDAVKESGRVLPRPSVVFHTYTSADRHGSPDTIPYNIHKEVGYCLTRRHVKLLILRIPYVPYALVHFKCLFIQTQPMRAINNTGGATTLELRISDQTTHPPSHPVFSIFP